LWKTEKDVKEILIIFLEKLLRKDVKWTELADDHVRCCALLTIYESILILSELHNLYSSPSIIRMIKSRRMRWAGHVARMGEKRNAFRVLVGKPEGKRPLGRPRRRWVDNIKMDLREIEWMEWTD
jgi:hypothetical protein